MEGGWVAHISILNTYTARGEKFEGGKRKVKVWCELNGHNHGYEHCSREEYGPRKSTSGRGGRAGVTPKRLIAPPTSQKGRPRLKYVEHSEEGGYEGEEGSEDYTGA